jgi:hypothetical protein
MKQRKENGRRIQLGIEVRWFDVEGNEASSRFKGSGGFFPK